LGTISCIFCGSDCYIENVEGSDLPGKQIQCLNCGARGRIWYLLGDRSSQDVEASMEQEWITMKRALHVGQVLRDWCGRA
jgi:hypothetical protein